ncbi:hypothetical protein LMG29542_08015 [Paraburkholderia humisilvae]|uniref:Uncharacterized protein n=1 Tax=Paraburkholderia humisilvae TaxID=627669 RepID=A0A6J5FB01_9BURK|nr:hypothetical protein LMG29542_08015 [Paraburkholderia humisilvae]
MPDTRPISANLPVSARLDAPRHEPSTSRLRPPAGSPAPRCSSSLRELERSPCRRSPTPVDLSFLAEEQDERLRVADPVGVILGLADADDEALFNAEFPTQEVAEDAPTLCSARPTVAQHRPSHRSPLPSQPAAADQGGAIPHGSPSPSTGTSAGLPVQRNRRTAVGAPAAPEADHPKHCPTYEELRLIVERDKHKKVRDWSGRQIKQGSTRIVQRYGFSSLDAYKRWDKKEERERKYS